MWLWQDCEEMLSGHWIILLLLPSAVIWAQSGDRDSDMGEKMILDIYNRWTRILRESQRNRDVRLMSLCVVLVSWKMWDTKPLHLDSTWNHFVTDLSFSSVLSLLLISSRHNFAWWQCHSFSGCFNEMKCWMSCWIEKFTYPTISISLTCTMSRNTPWESQEKVFLCLQLQPKWSQTYCF